MSSPVFSLRAVARTPFGYWWRARVRELALCWPISKLSNIASRVLWQISVLLLVFLDGVDYSSASMSGGTTVSVSIISWCRMFRADMCGERCGGENLRMIGAAVWAVGKFGEGMGGDILSGVDTLGGGLKTTLGGGAL